MQDPRGKEYGVRAVTLVNALKTPVPPVGKVLRYSPPWYADSDAWGDGAEKAGKYQMSGRLLSPYRDQILSCVYPSLDSLGDLGLMLSGGIVSASEIVAADAALAIADAGNLGTAPVQIGTWGLLGVFLQDGCSRLL